VFDVLLFVLFFVVIFEKCLPVFGFTNIICLLYIYIVLVCLCYCRVLNTDNMSILGLTIDYGPYGFMDQYNSSHVCNASGHSSTISHHFFYILAKFLPYGWEFCYQLDPPFRLPKGEAGAHVPKAQGLKCHGRGL